MSLLDDAAFRLMYAMEEEERAWEVFKDPLGPRWTATDWLRLRYKAIAMGDKPMRDFCVQRPNFETQGAAEHYVRWHCIRVAIVHTLCFWRKEIKCP